MDLDLPVFRSLFPCTYHGVFQGTAFADIANRRCELILRNAPVLQRPIEQGQIFPQFKPRGEKPGPCRQLIETALFVRRPFPQTEQESLINMDRRGTVQLPGGRIRRTGRRRRRLFESSDRGIHVRQNFGYEVSVVNQVQQAGVETLGIVSRHLQTRLRS